MVAEINQHCEQTLMFTDIVGYSRLMGRNEAMAVEMLGDYRKILLSHIEEQGGQLVEFVGDAIFARFNSAASATAAAIAIQQHLQAFNEVRDKKLPPLQTRIGLHKGEVMLRDNAVFGDSVNIAARLEPLAVPDGICISQTVYDEVRITLSSPAKRLGVQTLKNIEQKIRVYLIKPSGIGWRDHLFYFLRGLNKKIHAYRYPLTASLLALIVAGFYFIPRWLVPGYAANYVEIADFQNLMNEKGDADYFSAGITEAVRSQLADMRDVYIVDAKEGIHAPIRLEGSVQKLGDNLRIAYRLFRRKDNVQIAGGKLDGTYQDIFILQDRLVGEIARYLADEFDLQNFRPAPLRLTGDVTAYDYYLRGMSHLENMVSHEHVDTAIQNFNSALLNDPKFFLANTGICKAYWKKYEITSSASWLNNAEKHCLLAISQSSYSSEAYSVIGAIYRDTGKYEKALEYLNIGLNAESGSESIYIVMAWVYEAMKNNKMAEALLKKNVSLHPESWRSFDALGYFFTKNGRYGEAIDLYSKVLEFIPDNVVAINNIGANYVYLGEFDKAAKTFENASKIESNSDIFSNTGTMYYLSGDFEKSASMYKASLMLDPNNYKWMIHLADAYKFIRGNEKLADQYFDKAIYHIGIELEENPNMSDAYCYLAIADGYFGRHVDAYNALAKAEALDSENPNLLYSKLRVAIFAKNKELIESSVINLIKAGYSDKLLFVDPDFVVLKKEQFKGLLVNK